MLESGGRLHAILATTANRATWSTDAGRPGFELVCVTWGPGGTTLHRNGATVGSQKGIDAVSSDPAIAALRIGGPGSGGSPRFRGDVAEIRVYNRQLDESERALVEAELRVSWLEPHEPKRPRATPLAELYDELSRPAVRSGHRPDERQSDAPAEERPRLDALSRELEALEEQASARRFPEPSSFRTAAPGHSARRIQGRPGLSPRQLPSDSARPSRADSLRSSTGDSRQTAISKGSGRRELADWLTRPDNPLAARVMVNRIWQQHFGEGLVRTPNDFGERGERPTHPALLDYLAAQFVESGWSVKTMHRMIMLSSAYQQSSRASSDALASDPENRLLGRMNRRRLDAESIRDSLLAVAGRLDTTLGGAGLRGPRHAAADAVPAVRPHRGQRIRFRPPVRPRRSRIDRRPAEANRSSHPGPLLHERPVRQRAGPALSPRESSTRSRPATSSHQRLYALALAARPPADELELGLAVCFLAGGDATLGTLLPPDLCQNEFIYID